MESTETTAPDAAPSAPPVSGRRALFLIAGWLCLSIAARVMIESGTALLVIGLGFADGHSLDALMSDPELITEHMTATLVGAASLAQIVLLAALALVFARWLGPDLRTAFAWRRPATAGLVVALIGGLTVGFFPGWLAQQISANVPWLDWGNLELMNEMLASATWLGKAVLLVAIAFAAPLCEELIFRGFLWSAAERALPPVGVWLLTSALFAIYHVDPVHVIAVFFTGLFLGWVRWTTGSIGPSIAAHFANNALAALVVLAVPSAEEASNAGWAALLGVVATFGFSAALYMISSSFHGASGGRASRS